MSSLAPSRSPGLQSRMKDATSPSSSSSSHHARTEGGAMRRPSGPRSSRSRRISARRSPASTPPCSTSACGSRSPCASTSNRMISRWVGRSGSVRTEPENHREPAEVHAPSSSVPDSTSSRATVISEGPGASLGSGEGRRARALRRPGSCGSSARRSRPPSIVTSRMRGDPERSVERSTLTTTRSRRMTSAASPVHPGARISRSSTTQPAPQSTGQIRRIETSPPRIGSSCPATITPPRRGRPR